MRILVYGAGVLGTLYAARLGESGCDVSILARGQRLADIRANGLILENIASGWRTRTFVRTIEHLESNDAYDLAIVLVRKDQVSAVLPDLASNRPTPNVLFMHNNAAGPGAMIDALGRERVVLGFPGAAGTREGTVVRYAIIKQQRTTLGELDGRSTARLRQIAAMLRRAGFPISISSHMDAWLKTHVAFISSIAGAIYMAGGDCQRLAHMPHGVPTMVSAVREGFRVLHALDLPVTPFKLRILFEWLPRRIPVAYWRRYLGSDQAEHFFARHARSAVGEIKQLADEFRKLQRSSGVPTPSLDALYSCIDKYVACV